MSMGAAHHCLHGLGVHTNKIATQIYDATELSADASLGLPRVPAANMICLNAAGDIEGLF